MSEIFHNERIKELFSKVWDYLYKQNNITSHYDGNKIKFHVKRSENTIKIYLVREELYNILKNHFKYQPDIITHFLNMFERVYLEINKNDWINAGIYSFRMDNKDNSKFSGTYKYWYQMNLDHNDTLEHLNIVNMKLDTKDYSLVIDHPEETPLNNIKLDKYINMVLQMNKYCREVFINFLVSIIDLRVA